MLDFLRNTRGGAESPVPDAAEQARQRELQGELQTGEVIAPADPEVLKVPETAGAVEKGDTKGPALNSTVNTETNVPTVSDVKEAQPNTVPTPEAVKKDENIFARLIKGDIGEEDDPGNVLKKVLEGMNDGSPQ